MITKTIATSFHYHQELWHKTLKNADKTPIRCRVNGACKTWVTRPEDFRLPVKHGLRDCFYITPSNASDWSTPSNYYDDNNAPMNAQYYRNKSE